MTRLTATLIVRDESRFIEGCLQSLVGWVDEIVLVDTGSQDDTLARARRFPIKLHHFAWCDDFSAARNFALDHASGEWILSIDADERFEVPDPKLLDLVLSDPGKVAWLLRFHRQINWTPHADPRLFRNDPRIRFEGVIHESMLKGVDHVARMDGKETGICDLTLRHIGYEDDQAYKNSRNIPLLRARLARDPDHLYSWWHLGECLRLAGDEDGAIAAWTQGMTVAAARPPEARRPGDGIAGSSLIRLKVMRGEPVDDLLRRERALYPNELWLQWVEAMLALYRGDHDAALPGLEKLAAIDPETFFDPHLAYVKILFRQAKEALALCHFRAGRYAEAASCYRRASQAHPDPQACEIKARLAELRARSDQRQERSDRSPSGYPLTAAADSAQHLSAVTA